MKKTILILTLIFATNLMAQRDTIYYKNLNEQVSKDKACLYSVGNLSNGKKTGKWEIYRKDMRGKYYKKSEGFYKNNQKTGKWTNYSDHGSMVSTGCYTNDKRTGKWKFSYLGESYEEGEYKDGYKNGLWKIYDYRHKLFITENYQKGKLFGERKHYDNNGKIQKTENWLEGKLISTNHK